MQHASDEELLTEIAKHKDEVRMISEKYNLEEKVFKYKRVGCSSYLDFRAIPCPDIAMLEGLLKIQLREYNFAALEWDKAVCHYISRVYKRPIEAGLLLGSFHREQLEKDSEAMLTFQATCPGCPPRDGQPNHHFASWWPRFRGRHLNDIIGECHLHDTGIARIALEGLCIGTGTICALPPDVIECIGQFSVFKEGQFTGLRMA